MFIKIAAVLAMIPVGVALAFFAWEARVALVWAALGVAFLWGLKVLAG